MVRRAILAFALLIAGSAAAADPVFGTLFFSAEERARLDRLRRGESEPSAFAPAPGAGSAMTGFVKRSDGRATVWIDGRPVNVRGPQAAAVLDPSAVRDYVDPGEESLKIERKPPR